MLLDLRGRLHRLGLCDGDAFALPLLQREIADHRGLIAVHFNRVLRRLREAGLVRLKSGRASIGDPAALERIAAPLRDNLERAQPEFGGGAVGGQRMPRGIAERLA